MRIDMDSVLQNSKAKHPYFDGDQYPRIIAHRGLVTAEMQARGIVENTQESFAAGIAAGAHAIESDCHISKDGVAVLLHDPNMLRLTGDARLVSQLTVSQLRDLLQDKGGLLTLGDALTQWPDTKFQLDVKIAAAAETVGRDIAKHGDRVMLTSFSEQRRKTAYAAALAYSSGGIAPAVAPGKKALLQIWLAVRSGQHTAIRKTLEPFDALQIPEKYLGVKVLNERLLQAAKSMGVEVHVWTVNELHEMQRFIDMGAEGLITDRAALALTALL